MEYGLLTKILANSKMYVMSILWMLLITLKTALFLRLLVKEKWKGIRVQNPS